MKQVSIEKCLENVPNKFMLSLLAIVRAKNLMLGATPEITTYGVVKNSYIALKELEQNKLNIDELRELLKISLTRNELFAKNFDRNDKNNANFSELEESQEFSDKIDFDSEFTADGEGDDFYDDDLYEGDIEDGE